MKTVYCFVYNLKIQQDKLKSFLMSDPKGNIDISGKTYQNMLYEKDIQILEGFTHLTSKFILILDVK